MTRVLWEARKASNSDWDLADISAFRYKGCSIIMAAKWSRNILTMAINFTVLPEIPNRGFVLGVV